MRRAPCAARSLPGFAILRSPSSVHSAGPPLRRARTVRDLREYSLRHPAVSTLLKALSEAIRTIVIVY
jgi:hypothetical protein